MPATSQHLTPGADDRVSNVLKWILLAVAIGSFLVFFWATALTYEKAPPQPDRYVYEFDLCGSRARVPEQHLSADLARIAELLLG